MDRIGFQTPAQAGLDEKYLKAFMSQMQKAKINLHSVVMMRGNDIFFEKYWEPFTPDRIHRMYSETKSFVAIAIGFLLQEGKLSLDDKIIGYFPDKLPEKIDPMLQEQTIRDMLTMRTAFIDGGWFKPEVTDRLKFYFELPGRKYPGTLFSYDSCGSYVLGCLVERLSGMSMLDYLREKVFNKIGGFENAHLLRVLDLTPWADSALLCTPRDLARFARFVMNKGAWDGEQLLDPAYVEAATGYQTDNNLEDGCAFNTCGYGYQFWRGMDNSFFFNGMGAQFGICVPDKDFIFVCNADVQLTSADDSPRIFRAVHEQIVHHLDFAEDPEPEFDLDAPLKLSVARGEAHSEFEASINGRTFESCIENPMGLKKLRLILGEKQGCLEYENEQGEKVLDFGLAENVFVKFPQLGYSDEYGNLHEITDFRYDAAVSAGWIAPQTLQIRVQVIDRYFGILIITLDFKDPDKVSVAMKKRAEDFFNEYEGFTYARAIKE